MSQLSHRRVPELLRFANHAHVEIIIEFNLPAHANALIRSIAASGRYEIVDPDDQSTYTSAQGYSRNVVNVCQPDTFVLTRRILETIAKYYSMAGLRLRHIHLGGDELPAGAWLGSPVCRNAPFWSPDWDMTSESDREAATGVLQKYYVESMLNIIRDIDPDVMTGFWHEMAPSSRIRQIPTSPAGTLRIRQLVQSTIFSVASRIMVANTRFLYLDMPYSLHAEEPVYLGQPIRVQGEYTTLIHLIAGTLTASPTSKAFKHSFGPRPYMTRLLFTITYSRVCLPSLNELGAKNLALGVILRMQSAAENSLISTLSGLNTAYHHPAFKSTIII